MLGLSVPDYIRTLVPYVPGKPIEETQREFNLKRVIKLASNENPLGPSPKALAAARNVLKEQHRYPDSSAYYLKNALSKDLGFETGSILIGNGSNEIIDLLVRTYCVAGDAIVTSHAAFLAYRICAQIHGVRTIETPLTEGLRFDVGAMAEAVRKDARVRLVFLPNPNNPTGTYVAENELRGFLKEVSSIRGGSVLVVLDYAYWEYVTAKDLPDPMKLARDFPNVVVTRTFSKIYGLAGFRVGYGVGTREVMAMMEKVRMPFNINTPGLAAAEAALSDRAFVKKARQLNSEGMKFWEKALHELSIPFWKSQGNFILADVGAGLGKTGPDGFQSCLRRGVIFRPVPNYGLPNGLRISVGTMAENRIAAAALRDEVAGRPVKAAGARKSTAKPVRASTKSRSKRRGRK